MPLTHQEVEHIARLARLELSEEEKARYREQLSAILDHVAQLQRLNTADIPPTASILGAAAPLRPDRPRPALPPDKVLGNAAQSEQGQFKIPPVFD